MLPSTVIFALPSGRMTIMPFGPAIAELVKNVVAAANALTRRAHPGTHRRGVGRQLEFRRVCFIGSPLLCFPRRESLLASLACHRRPVLIRGTRHIHRDSRHYLT